MQVEFNTDVVMRYRLVGYGNRAVADDQFRDNEVDAGEIGAGHSVTALYEIKLYPDAHGKLQPSSCVGKTPIHIRSLRSHKITTQTRSHLTSRNPNRISSERWL